MGLIKGKQIASGSVALDRLAEAVIQADGGQAFTGDQPMGSNKITGLANGTASGDAVNKGQLDAAVAGLQWREPVAVLNLIGNATIATINGLSPASGDAYVATDAGTPTAGTSDALVAGSVAEYDGTSWKEIVAGSGGFVPSGTRAVLSTATALISPYTDATDDGKLVDFDGAGNTGADTSEATDGSAVLVNAEGGVNENKAYVFDGTVPTGSWIQFAGSGAGLGGTPAALGAANAEGSSSNSARADHVHVRDSKTQETLTSENITGSDTALGDTLAAVPLDNAHFQLYLNGQLQEEGAGNDYTRSSQTITWLASSGTAVDMENTDELIAVYTVQGA